MILHSLKSIWRTEHGSALLEGAIVLPIFLTLVCGVYEFGFYLYQRQMIAAGIRDATRYLALTDNPNNLTYQVNARNLAVTGSITGGTARVPGWSTDDVTVEVSTVNNQPTTSSRTMVQIVTVSTHFADPSLGFLGLLRLSAPMIDESHQERYVGGSY
ncbi:MAG: TadE/TadG family type IV pilus assembly protein [Candidatus Binatia bacterium]